MIWVAFLRGMNLGRRRITNEELCACFEELGLANAWAFLASGNVAFESSARSRAKLKERVEAGLRDALGYDVPTFLRSGEEVAAIAAATPFAESTGTSGGKLQVCLLAGAPSAAKRKAALTFATEEDRLALDGEELYWLPDGPLTQSGLDMKGVAAAVGDMTVRTHNTLQRLSRKLGTS